MIQTSEQTDKLDQALASVLSKVSGLERSATNPFTKSKYPNLEDTWRVLRPALRDHGISVTQHPFKADEKHIGLETRVAKDGQWMKSELVMPVLKWDPQGWGAGLTYAKRYALQAIFGLAEDDDDGNTASGRGPDASQTRSNAKFKAGPAPMPKTGPQVDWENYPHREIEKPKEVWPKADWENHAQPHIEKAAKASKESEGGHIDDFLTDAAKQGPQSDEHGAYVVRMGKNAGKRIDAIGEKGLRDFMKWFEDRVAKKEAVAPLVVEYYEHAGKFLGL